MDLSKHTISLVLFYDGASLAKTGKNSSIWTMFSMILDLPKELRSLFKNIMTHYIIGHSNPDLDQFNKNHLTPLLALKEDGLMVDDSIYYIKVLG